MTKTTTTATIIIILIMIALYDYEKKSYKRATLNVLIKSKLIWLIYKIYRNERSIDLFSTCSYP